MATFIDKAKIHVKSGSGGNGIVAWRREKFVAFGGPAGGDGGKGGDIIIEATEDLNTLLDFKHQSIFKAGDGEKGMNKNMHGKSGKDLTIRVPCGTIVRDGETGDAIADLTMEGQQVVVAIGGRGGRGNARFMTSKNQAPQFSEPGEPAIERELELELKLIAEVGIIGLPNAGKSTLISVISAAKPKIANYPFTTLVPNLGVVKKPDGNGVVVADIPGLVEGAHSGVGLGHEFLRHVERTRLLVHVIDMTVDLEEREGQALENFRLINQELEKYSGLLSKKPQILVLNKMDSVPEDYVETLRAKFRAEADTAKSKHNSPEMAAFEPGVFAISAATRQGVDQLLSHLFAQLDAIPKQEQVVELVADYKAFNNDDSAFEIERKGKQFFVDGGKIDRLFQVTDMKNRAAVFRLMNILKAMGVFSALAAAGAHEGHVISIAGLEFDYLPDDSDESFMSPRARRKLASARGAVKSAPGDENGEDADAYDDEENESEDGTNESEDGTDER
ncbi:MAG: GTPase ObgE [Vampirovibrionales bacterium]|nr:GTPase ObgE [Vampirovibrionales bacterium]